MSNFHHHSAERDVYPFSGFLKLSALSYRPTTPGRSTAWSILAVRSRLKSSTETEAAPIPAASRPRLRKGGLEMIVLLLLSVLHSLELGKEQHRHSTSKKIMVYTRNLGGRLYCPIPLWYRSPKSFQGPSVRFRCLLACHSLLNQDFRGNQCQPSCCRWWCQQFWTL